MARLAKLFTPCSIRNVEFKNRICMAPMGTIPADAEGLITDRAIDFFAARARGGEGCTRSGTGSSRDRQTNLIQDSRWFENG